MHPVDQHLKNADRAIAKMQAAAVAARTLHARAELLRHMRTTAAKLTHLPVAEAANKTMREWLNAWKIAEADIATLGPAALQFAEAFCRDAHGSTKSTQAAIVDALAALDVGFTAIGTTLADQMAYRSVCAHPWWGQVAPDPVRGDQPIWAHDRLPEHCR